MTCKRAIVEDIVTISPESSVAELFELLHEKNIRAAVVVDENGDLVGLANFQSLIKAILPFSATMEDGLIDIQFMHAEAAEAAEKLEEVKAKKVSDIMLTDVATVTPETTFLECLFLLYKHGSPLPVVEPGSKKVVGILSKQSALFNLEEGVLGAEE